MRIFFQNREKRKCNRISSCTWKLFQLNRKFWVKVLIIQARARKVKCYNIRNGFAPSDARHTVYIHDAPFIGVFCCDFATSSFLAVCTSLLAVCSSLFQFAPVATSFSFQFAAIYYYRLSYLVWLKSFNLFLFVKV